MATWGQEVHRRPPPASVLQRRSEWVLVRGPGAGQVPAGCSTLGPFCPRFWPPAPSFDSSDAWWPLLDRVGFKSGRWGYIYPEEPLRGCVAKGWWAGPLQRGLALQQGMCPHVGWDAVCRSSCWRGGAGWDTWPDLSSQWGSGSQVLPKPGVPTTPRSSGKFTGVQWDRGPKTRMWYPGQPQA